MAQYVDQKVANTAAEVAKQSAQVSIDAAKVAAKAKLDEVKENLQDGYDKNMASAEALAQQAKDKISTFAGDALDAIADKASDLAAKLKS